MPKLYYWPATCSIAIRVILEEIGEPYKDERVDLGVKQQHAAEFLRVNPKAKVPALVRDDGSVLTEVPAIASWLALTHPHTKLMPTDAEGRARAVEILEYVAGTIHMHGAARAWRPASFIANEAEHPAVQARGREIVMRGMTFMSVALGGKSWLLGDYSVADPSLFFIEYWMKEKVGWDMPENIETHYLRMRERPAVIRALAREGLA